jgi:hypothetical protein
MQHDYPHTSFADDSKKMLTAADELNDINFVLMRENIEKMKRIKILKKVRCSFDNVFSRVQDLTDGLKTQLDEALIEHRKANKIAHKLHKHVSGMKGDLEGFQWEDLIISNMDDMERTHLPGHLQQKFAVRAIESATSSRSTSLPDVFKVDSSDKGHPEEEFRMSRTRNIRTIAVKKSQEKSQTETNGERRKKYSANINREKSATRERNISQTTQSSNSKLSMTSVNQKLRNKTEGNESDTPDKSKQICHKTAKKSAKDFVKTTIPGSQQDNISCNPEQIARRNQAAETLLPLNQQKMLNQKRTVSVAPFDKDLLNKSLHDSRNQSKYVRKMPNLRKDKIENEIKNTEECIQPRKMETESLNNNTTAQRARKQPGRRTINRQQDKDNWKI